MKRKESNEKPNRGRSSNYFRVVMKLRFPVICISFEYEGSDKKKKATQKD